MGRTHRGKAAYAGNPEIPIRTDVLRVAMESRGWGPSDLARATGDTQQTISALVNSTRPDRRCRADRARRIAKALQVPLEWLTGGVVVPPVHPVVWPGYEFRYSARTQFAASRLLTRCALACRRDLERQPLGSLKGLPGEMFVGQLIGLVAELIQVGRWRQWLLAWKPGVQERRGYTEPASDNPFTFRSAGARERLTGEPPVPPGFRAIGFESAATPQVDEDHETAIVSLCRAIEHTLAPWFDDEARLNYAALYHLTSLPGVVPQTFTDPYSPAAAMPPSVADRLAPAAAQAPRKGPPSRSTQQKKLRAKRRAKS